MRYDMLYILYMVKYGIIDICNIINIVSMVSESHLMFCLLDYESHVAEINTYPVVITVSSSIARFKIWQKPHFSAHCGHTELKQSEAKIKNKSSQTMKLRAWTKHKTLLGKWKFILSVIVIQACDTMAKKKVIFIYWNEFCTYRLQTMQGLLHPIFKASAGRSPLAKIKDW